jgi:hypothetical protein
VDQELLLRNEYLVLQHSSHGVRLIPAPDFQLAAFETRGSLWSIAGKTTDPDCALSNLLERDLRHLARLIRCRCRQSISDRRNGMTSCARAKARLGILVDITCRRAHEGIDRLHSAGGQAL